MTRFMTKNKIIPTYMAFPRFILENTTLNEIAKILNILERMIKGNELNMGVLINDKEKQIKRTNNNAYRGNRGT